MSLSVIVLLVIVALAVGALVWAELRVRGWRAQLEGYRTAAARASAARGESPPPEPGAIDIDAIEPLGQDDYVHLLERDHVRLARFAYRDDRDDVEQRHWSSALSMCRCGERAVRLSIAHPIWDGPFHGAGSGRVDVRVIPVCPHCDRFDRHLETELGVWPAPVLKVGDAWATALNTGQASGRPIRLPWLNRDLSGHPVPVALHATLYERPAFHNLMTPVARAGPRPPAPSREPHRYTISGPGDQLQHVAPAGQPARPCEICDQPFDAALHRVEPIHDRRDA